MSQIQKTIFLLCIATVYAASISNMSEEEFSAEFDESLTPSTKNSYDSNLEKNEGEITEYDPLSPSFIVSEQTLSNGFQVGKSLIESMLGMLQIVRQMDLSQDGLKNITFMVARILSMFVGKYYETFKKFMPMFYGMAMAVLETLR